jgi:hypothetical protein
MSHSGSDENIVAVNATLVIAVVNPRFSAIMFQ